MSLFNRFHDGYVHSRRVRVLSKHLSNIIARDACVLDVGCGDGLLAHLITEKLPETELRGIDVLVRGRTYVPVDKFDGHVIPFDDASFDVVMFVDVLHHTQDPMSLLREAARVAKSIVIKDHILAGFLADSRLRLMDWAGNAHHNVDLPYNYWPRQKWLEAFKSLELKVSIWTEQIGLYPRPISWVFERSLHFIARLDSTRRAAE